MELRHLRYFVTVATELHYARAARRLFISQPGLSQQIRSLEGELGLKLFERNRRGVRLTPEGAAFLSEAAAVVQQADRALEVARALAEAATGQLRLSYARTMFTGLPDLIVSEYQRRFPGVEITADSGTTGSNVDRLRSGEVDIAFVLTPLEDPGDLRWVDVSREPIVVALPSGHPLSRHRRIRRDQVAVFRWCTSHVTRALAITTAVWPRSMAPPSPTSSVRNRPTSACWWLLRKVRA